MPTRLQHAVFWFVQIKPPSSMEKDGDPMASLMGLMKVMQAIIFEVD
jgi:hypothetical protein